MNQIEADAQKFATLLVALTPLIRSGISSEVIHDDAGYGIKLAGFYKDGSVTVRVQGDGEQTYVVAGRYDSNLLEIYPGDDACEALIRLNAERFLYWSDVKPEFNTIDASWRPLLKNLGLVRDKVTIEEVIS